LLISTALEAQLQEESYGSAVLLVTIPPASACVRKVNLLFFPSSHDLQPEKIV